LSKKKLTGETRLCLLVGRGGTYPERVFLDSDTPTWEIQIPPLGHKNYIYSDIKFNIAFWVDFDLCCEK
jgi:hypothetical protein